MSLCTVESCRIERHQLVISELIVERRNAFRRRMRDELNSSSRSIEIQAETPFQPLYPDRPYGLPSDFEESGILDIWEKILKFVVEADEVIKLSGICRAFQHILSERYNSVKLVEVMEYMAKTRKYKSLIPSKDLLLLRLLNRTVKKFFDGILMKEREEVDSRLEYLISGLKLRVRTGFGENARLQGMLNSLQSQGQPIPRGTFPLRKVTFDEAVETEEGLRDSVQRLFELVGESIHSLTFLTHESSLEAYNILRRWTAILPNVEELTVGVGGEFGPVNVNQPLVEPLPTLHHLKRYIEADYMEGLVTPYLLEILRANPTILNVKLSLELRARGNQRRLEKAIGSMPPLEVFSFEQEVLLPLLQLQLKWPLRTLELARRIENENGISSTMLFNFVNQFGETLKRLVLLRDIQDDGGALELPNLATFHWWHQLQRDSLSLEFMVKLQSLKYFVLHVKMGTSKEQTLEYLKKWGIPSLFPGLRRIGARDQHHWYRADESELIWECSQR